MRELQKEAVIALTLYGVVVVLTVLGGILGPPIVLLPAAGLAVLWVVILVEHRREQRATES
jgi:hypothetical protein